MSGHVARWAIGVAGALAALGYIGLGNPHRPGFLFPPCPFHAITGLDCPGCGGLRMVHDLLHGDLAGAAADNPFALLLIPVLAVWVPVRLRRGRPVAATRPMLALAVAAGCWMLIRN